MIKFLMIMTLLVCAFATADEYSIDIYSFEWEVAQAGDVSMSVVKTDETKYIYLRKGGYSLSSIRLSPADAEAIGKELKKAGDYSEKQKNSTQDVREAVDVGDYRVSYNTSMKYGFSVIIVHDMESFSLDKKELSGIVPILSKSTELVAFLDKKILM